jgi:nucleoid-associated protein YgaU
MGRSIPPFERFGKATPQADANLEEYTFVAGDTITHLAHRFYGDWRLWRTIANQNNIIDVRTIEPGTLLLIPPRELESGRYEST